MIYAKIAIRNAKESFKEYLVYFLTLVIFISMVYGMSSISGNEDLMKTSHDMKKLFGTFNTFIVFISVIFALIIIFINMYIKKIRKKEIGIYLTLGLSRERVTCMLLIENFIFISGAFISGTIMGILLSKWMGRLCTKIFEGAHIFSFGVSYKAITRAAVLSVLIYIITAFMNLDIFSYEDIYDLLNSHKKSQKIKVKFLGNSKKIGGAGIALLVTSYLLIYMYMFKGFNDKILMVAILLFPVGVYIMYYGFSGILMSWKENHLDRSYRGINLFTFHQFTSKINDNSFFMGTSAILLTFAIMFSVFGFDAASSMKINAEKDRKIVSDIMFTYDDGSMEFEEVLEVIRKKTGIREWCQVKIYDFSKEDVAYYMLLSDYNNLMVMAGNEPLDLEGTEFLVHSNYESVSGRDVQYEVPKKIYIGENQMEGVLSPYVETVIDRRLSPILYRDKNHLFIVADEYVVGELDAVGVLFVNTLKQPEYNLRNEISKMNSMRNSSKIDKINVFNQRVLYSMNIRSESVNGWLRREAEFLFMGLYLAIIILICIVTFLSIHIMSDFRSYKENVDILRNLGARQSEIDKSIKVQLAMYFIFPLFAAVITNIVIDAFFFFSYLGAGDIMRVKALIINMGMVAVFIGVVYLGYGVLCYRHMKRHLEV